MIRRTVIRNPHNPTPSWKKKGTTVTGWLNFVISYNDIAVSEDLLSSILVYSHKKRSKNQVDSSKLHVHPTGYSLSYPVNGFCTTPVYATTSIRTPLYPYWTTAISHFDSTRTQLHYDCICYLTCKHDKQVASHITVSYIEKKLESQCLNITRIIQHVYPQCHPRAEGSSRHWDKKPF